MGSFNGSVQVVIWCLSVDESVGRPQWMRDDRLFIPLLRAPAARVQSVTYDGGQASNVSFWANQTSSNHARSRGNWSIIQFRTSAASELGHRNIRAELVQLNHRSKQRELEKAAIRLLDVVPIQPIVPAGF